MADLAIAVKDTTYNAAEEVHSSLVPRSTRYPKYSGGSTFDQCPTSLLMCLIEVVDAAFPTSPEHVVAEGRREREVGR